jgi:hypothetical protein
MTAPMDSVMGERLGRIKKVLEVFDAGQMSAVKAVSKIEDIASGEDDRIVHVGNVNRPEIET